MRGKLDVLLVEDNPGDVRLIEEMLRDAEELFRRVDSGDVTTGKPRVHHESRLSAGLEVLEATDADVILLDLGLPDSTGLETLETVVDEAKLTPIVVLTGLDDRELGIRAIQRGAQDYLVKDEVTSDVLVRSIHYAVERHESLQRIEAQRAQLDTLTHVYRVVQAIQQDVVKQAAREAMEQTVCERLVDIGLFRFAWIGRGTSSDGVITPSASAGHEDGYLDQVTAPLDYESADHGPGGEAIRTKEVQVVSDVETDEEFARWRDATLARGYRSLAAVPIVYEQTTFGILGVYAAKADAFGPELRNVLGGLGELLGHAIAASTQKQALQSGTVVAVELQFNGIAVELGVDGLALDPIDFTRVVPLGQGSYLLYGRMSAGAREDVDELGAVDGVDSARVLASDDERVDFELQMTDPPVMPIIAAYGGRFHRSVLDDDSLTATVEFPPAVEIREVVDQLEATYPELTISLQRREVRERTEFSEGTVLDELTDRQRTAVEAAHFAGYFEWPRDSSAEEIAEKMDISPPTFHQHLRKAQGKVFRHLFEE